MADRVTGSGRAEAYGPVDGLGQNDMQIVGTASNRRETNLGEAKVALHPAVGVEHDLVWDRLEPEPSLRVSRGFDDHLAG